MTPPKVPCALCGTPILPETAARTDGRCMPCSRDPAGRRVVDFRAARGDSLPTCPICRRQTLPETAARTNGRCIECFETPGWHKHQEQQRAAEQLAAHASLEQVLERLEVLLPEATLRAARDAATSHGHEGIYAFWMHYEYFAMFGTAVFTEATLDADFEQARQSPYWTVKVERELVRWRHEGDWPHRTDFNDGEIGVVLRALHAEYAQVDEARRDEVNEALERFSIQALRRVREEGIFDRRVVLLKSSLFSDDAEWLASAEHCNDHETLDMFRRQLRSGEA